MSRIFNSSFLNKEQRLAVDCASFASDTWTTIIRPKNSFFQINLKEILEYRELIFLFLKRDFKTMYKQTILGPVWILLNPLLTTFVFTIVFGRIAQISTDGVPDFLFYMAGNLIWVFFSSCLTSTANTFLGNARLLGKVYFPGVILPLSNVLSRLVTFGVQFLLFSGFVFWHQYLGNVHVTVWCLILPLLLLESAVLAMGVGMILASLTAKYRDLQVLVGFGVQLWMYITPVVYPISQISPAWRRILLWNPMAAITESFRYGWLGSGAVSWKWLGTGGVISLCCFVFGLLLFQKTQRVFVDTV